MRVLFALLLLFSGSIAATLPAHYMQTIGATTVWAQIGNKMVTIGNIRAGQILAVKPIAADYYESIFGFGIGFIDRGHLKSVQGRQKVDDGLGDLNKPPSNQSLATWKSTPVYSAPDIGSAPSDVLAGNLRHPIISKLKDRLNQTWFRIRIGGRLAYISALDAQEDDGISVSMYRHILRDEENTRFRRTSTTTSIRAFSNQMAWFQDRNYTMLTIYQPEGYARSNMSLSTWVVVLTFDSGLKSVSRHTYPILKQYGFKAAAFIIGPRVRRHPQKRDPKSLQLMNLPELNEIRDVFDFQLHTHFLYRMDASHRPILLSRSYYSILFDFIRSRRALSQFNPHVLYPSYPLGGYNTTMVWVASDAGFHLIATMMKEKVKSGDNPFLLKCLYILGTDSLETMVRLTSNQLQGQGVYSQLMTDVTVFSEVPALTVPSLFNYPVNGME